MRVCESPVPLPREPCGLALACLEILVLIKYMPSDAEVSQGQMSRASEEREKACLRVFIARGHGSHQIRLGYMVIE